MDLGDDHDRPKQSAKRDPKKRLSKNGVSSELPPLFVAADQNKDGYVSKDEHHKAGVAMFNFDAADKNKDNKLNLSEWTLLKF